MVSKKPNKALELESSGSAPKTKKKRQDVIPSPRKLKSPPDNKSLITERNNASLSIDSSSKRLKISTTKVKERRKSFKNLLASKYHYTYCKYNRAELRAENFEYDDKIWDAQVDGSELYFPVFIADNLKDKKLKTLKSSKKPLPTLVNHGFQNGFSSDSKRPPGNIVPENKTSKLSQESSNQPLILTTGAFSVEGGIVDNSSASDLPPHTVCVVSAFERPSKKRLEETFSHFGNIISILRYTASRPPVAYVAFKTESALDACLNSKTELMGSNCSLIRCHGKKLTETEAQEACGQRFLQFLKSSGKKNKK
ncbi:uncharacterized protein LOC108674834 isoform X1 [Hyalella azteca]|uniref:Uncharacterized protein LOC108674834 isoform X1 n=1 Tax=Hyalella azteca TaxID=294128 RepID=A0A8B7NX27_HYAAZ|nr:uncharacterized protein LOC108674834 isoform X1 [Hyalella azteca]